MCPRVLGELPGVIARLLLVIFEMSGQTGWEMADIAPIFKQGKKEHLRNYRLVSHISVPGKVMENIYLRNSFTCIHHLLLSEMSWVC